MRRLGIFLATLICLTAAPSSAVVPTDRVVTDPADPGAAWDVRRVTLRAADGERAAVVVRHGRAVAVGDVIDVWIDTDDDASPDIYVTGLGFSESAAYIARGWRGHGRDISDRGCVSLKMTGRRSVLRFDPSCLAPSTRFSVSVRSSVHEEPASTDDYVPARRQLTGKVRSYRPGQ
jgi:hypothetical protein